MADHDAKNADLEAEGGDAAEEAPKRSRSWWRLPLWLAAGLVALLLAYLVAGNLFLRPDWGPPRLNRRPEKFQIQWSRGWTLIPGVVHLEGLVLDAKAGRGRWHLELDRVQGKVALWELGRRRFHVLGARGSGLVFQAELPPFDEPSPLEEPPGSEQESTGQESSGAGPAAEPASALPEPTQSAPTQPAPTQLAPTQLAPTQPEPAPAKRPPWRILLNDVALDEVREVQVEPYRYRGQGVVRGNLDATTQGGPLAVSSAHLTLGEGKLEILDQPAAKVETLTLDLRFDAATKEQRRGRSFLRFLSSELELAATDAQLSSLAFLFRRVPTMDLAGEGSLRLRLALDHGVVQAGTTLYAQAESQVRYLDYTVRGGGEIAGAVTAADGDSEPQATLDLTFDQYEVVLDGTDEPHVFGRGATVQLTTSALDLVALEPQTQPPSVRAVVDLPDSQVPKLAYYNRFLPAGSDIRILAGRGRLSGRVVLQAPEGSWSGQLHLVGEGLRLKLKDQTVEGRLTLDAQLPGGDIRSRRANLSGTRLRIDGARILGRSGPISKESWWARVELPRGRVTVAKPLALDTTFRATLKDTTPLLAFVRKEGKSPGWLAERLTGKEVKGSGQISFQAQRIEARKLDFKAGEDIEVLGEVRLAKPDWSALLFCRYRKLSVSVEMKDGERDWDLVGSRKWFVAKEKEWSTGVSPSTKGKKRRKRRGS
jgi:hypothetical protein